MKKILKNKVYDTETAALIGTFVNGTEEPRNLYLKKTGEFFLAYAETDDRILSLRLGDDYKKSDIVPLSYAEGMKIINDFFPSKKKDLFKRKEPKKKYQVSISLDASTHDRIKKEAMKKGVTISQLICEKFKK